MGGELGGEGEEPGRSEPRVAGGDQRPETRGAEPEEHSHGSS